MSPIKHVTYKIHDSISSDEPFLNIRKGRWHLPCIYDRKNSYYNTIKKSYFTEYGRFNTIWQSVDVESIHSGKRTIKRMNGLITVMTEQIDTFDYFVVNE